MLGGFVLFVYMIQKIVVVGNEFSHIELDMAAGIAKILQMNQSQFLKTKIKVVLSHVIQLPHVIFRDYAERITAQQTREEAFYVFYLAHHGAMGTGAIARYAKKIMQWLRAIEAVCHMDLILIAVAQLLIFYQH